MDLLKLVANLVMGFSPEHFSAFIFVLKNRRFLFVYRLWFCSGDIQDSPGQGPVQPAVGEPALQGGWTRW